MRSVSSGRLLTTVIVGVAVAALASISAYATKPPWVFRTMQDGAPEALRIVVLAVNDKVTHKSRVESGRTIDVENHALTIAVIVERVTRSSTGLRPLSIIEIAYSTQQEFRDGRPHYSMFPGSTSGPGKLSQGQRVPAYLAFDQQVGFYTPYAEHASFSEPYPAR